MGTIAIPAAEKGLNSTESVPTYRGPFATMTVFNDLLILRFKEVFTLNYFEAMLVQFAFFGAYFIGSLVYFIISVTTGDPTARIGYKNGVVIGLLISASGNALFWPAARIWHQFAAPPN
jgi:FHS family L-fucose permease-like MFS transporter